MPVQKHVGLVATGVDFAMALWLDLMVLVAPVEPVEPFDDDRMLEKILEKMERLLSVVLCEAFERAVLNSTISLLLLGISFCGSVVADELSHLFVSM